jgi:cysteine protease ATG4
LDYTDEEVASCHTRRLRRIDVTEMDPSMLIGFLIRNEEDWRLWRKGITDVPGKAIVHVADKEPPLSGQGTERASAIDEVEVLDTEEDDF